MLGFHRRTRSLIPVKDLAKYDRVPLNDQQEDDEVDMEDSDTLVDEASEATDKARSRQLTLIYAVFLAEAIMASSLQPQLQMLISESDYCGNLSTSYLRSILDCAYAFGGTTGLFWGYMADRMGRRRVTLIGLWMMVVCCLSMGFATDLATCTLFRYFAGLASSTVAVTTLTMIGDLSKSFEERVRNLARLPLIALFGSIGSILQGMVSESLHSSGAVWERFPILGSQLACTAIVLLITLTATFMLEETLSLETSSSHMDCERAAFLSENDSDAPKIAVIDFIRPEPITINQFMQAPSFLVLLASFSLLSLHASVFDVVLPHLGHQSSREGGMGIPCHWLGVTVLIVKGVAGITIKHAVPAAVDRFGLLKLYRSASLLFPGVYVVTPLLALAAASACSTSLVAMTSTMALVVKHTLTGGASVLVALLVLNTTPDAYSAGTVIGIMQIANLFKALAVAVSGASFYLADEVSVSTTNLALWTCLMLFGSCGAALAYFVRERPSVDRDFPSEVLCWETCYDADAEKSEFDT